VLLGYGNRPGDVLNDAAALERATTFFAAERIAEDAPLSP
jgi:hypothetical protein